MDNWTFPEDVRGWLTEGVGYTLAELAKGRTILEIGSWCGRSTVCMAQTAKQVHALDWGKGDDGTGPAWVTPELLDNLKRYGLLGKCVLHVGGVDEVGSTLADASFDLTFVDGAHDYASVKRDFLLAKRVTKPGGVIAFHDFVGDYHSPYIQQAALEVLGPDLEMVVGSLAVHKVPVPPRLPTVFVGMPTRTAIHWGAMHATHNMGTKHRITELKVQSTSLLTTCFNRLWCDALNSKPRPDVFCMLHDDIMPEKGWLDTLLSEMQRTGADVVSCIMPIKDERGVTSTAIMNPATQKMRRITQTEAMNLPMTFDAEMAGFPGHYLLPNTGCWVCRFRKDWVEEVVFTMRDRIIKNSAGDFEAVCFSEDWMFGYWAAQRGLKVMATTAVKAFHVGIFNYPNFTAWGGYKTDEHADQYEVLFNPPDFTRNGLLNGHTKKIKEHA